jgi:O-antigen/teichoic acid export membrane protein
MDNENIKRKSISGAKWTVLLSTLALPIGYVVNVILGRISPETLGIYALISVVVGFSGSFLLFGGNNVVQKYLPEIEDNQKIDFILTYSIIVTIISLLSILLMLIFPQILVYVTGSETSPDNGFYYIIILILVSIFFNLYTYMLSGLMEIKMASIINKITTYGNFPIFLFIFIFFPSYFLENNLHIIFLSFILFYSVGGLLAAVIVFKNVLKLKQENLTSSNIVTNFKLFLPKKFWSTSITVHLSTVMYYFSDKLDQILILNFFNLTQLGLYYAPLQIAILVRFIPSSLGNVLLPTFSNFLANNDLNSVKQWYSKIIKYNALITFPMAFIIIFFSKYILLLFGEEYLSNYYILVILTFLYSTGIISPLNNAIIIAKGKVQIYLLCEFLSIILGIIIAFSLINPLGILGLAIYRGLTIFNWQLITQEIVKRFDLQLKIDISYIIGVLISFICALIYLAFPYDNFFYCAFLFGISTISFLYLSKYKKEDIKFILTTILNRGT